MTNDNREKDELDVPEEEDFEALFAASEMRGAGEASKLELGELVRGRIVGIGKESAFVDLGGKTEGCLQLAEYLDEDGQPTLEEGQEIEAYVVSLDDGVQLSAAIARAGGDLAQLEAAHEAEIPVEGTVSAINKGGAEVMVAGLRAFCPVSQLDNQFVPDPSVFVGQTLRFLIQRLEGGRRPNLVLSRRRLLEDEAAVKARETRKLVVEGARLKGQIRSVRDFGAFVDLGGLDGLVHVSEISWQRVDDPTTVLAPGDEVEVVVLKVDWEKNRISLSLRALEPDPWEDLPARFPVGSSHEGIVQRVADYGAFVELAPGLDGLVHVSELDWKRVSDPNSAVAPGDRVRVRVLEVDQARKRISLSIKQASGVDPWLSVTENYPEGTVVQGTVEKIEPFGVFVELQPGLTALLPVSESGTERGSDLRRHFRPGQSVTAQVLSVSPDDRRMSLSVVAVAEAEERAEVENFKRDRAGAAGRGQAKQSETNSGLSTFGALLRDFQEKGARRD